MHKTQCISKMMSLFCCLAKIGILTNILGGGTTATARQPWPSEKRQWKWHDSQRGILYNSLRNPCNILYITLTPISLKNRPFFLLKLLKLYSLSTLRRPQPLPTAETGPTEESAAHSANTSKGSKFLAKAPMTLSFSRLPTNHPEALPLAPLLGAPLVRTPFSPKAGQTTGKSMRFSNGAMTFHQMAPVSV